MGKFICFVATLVCYADFADCGKMSFRTPVLRMQTAADFGQFVLHVSLPAGGMHRASHIVLTAGVPIQCEKSGWSRCPRAFKTHPYSWPFCGVCFSCGHGMMTYILCRSRATQRLQRHTMPSSCVDKACVAGKDLVACKLHVRISGQQRIASISICLR